MDCLLKEEKQVKDMSLLAYIYIHMQKEKDLNVTVVQYIKHLNTLLSNNREYISNTYRLNDNDNERIVNDSLSPLSGDVFSSVVCPSPVGGVCGSSQGIPSSHDYSPSGGRRKPDRFGLIVAAWNDMAAETGISQIVGITKNSQRQLWLKTRISEYGEDAILKAIDNVRHSEFLINSKFFNFDWMIRPNNFIKVLEGNYSRGTTATVGGDDDWRCDGDAPE